MRSPQPLAETLMVGRDLRFPPEPGRGIKVLVSARSLADCDAAGWARRLEWQGVAVPMELPLLGRAGVAEVLQSMGDPLVELAAQVDAVGELHRLSEGDPLLVRLYVEALRQTGNRAAFLKPEDLKGLKPGLEAYFDQWWKDQEWQWEKQGRDPLDAIEATQDLLYLCATALGPLSRDEVAAIAGGRLASGLRLQTIASEVGRFIIGDGRTQGYIFSHPRLGYYFREERMTELGRLEWEQRFLDFGRSILERLNSGKFDPRQAPPYAVRYYGVHLERAGADSDLFHELVSEGWQRAWEVLEGSYDGFLSDLARAWKRAEAAGAQAQSMQDRGQVIGQQCRYALIVASIKSLAGNIPPALLVALVDKGIWTSIQGLAYARQIVAERWRAQALAKLAPHLSEPLLHEALVEVRALADEYYRAQALAGLAPHLSESLLQEAIVEARGLAGEYRRVWTLTLFAPRLSEPLRGTVLHEALAAAREIRPELERVRALTGLAPHLSEPLRGTVLHEALAAARAVANSDDRARALTGLAPHLSEPLLHEALAAARAVAIADARVWALTGLAPYLSEPLRGTVLHEALAAVREIRPELERVRALTGLAPHLSEPVRGTVLHEALAAVREIRPELERVRALTGLAPHLSEPLLHEALAAVREIRPELERAWALTGLAPYLSEPLLHEALAVARTITYEPGRAQALTGLAPHVKQLPVVRLYALWCETLRLLTLRRDLLSDIQALVPVIAALGEKEALVATAQAIIEVGKWFP